MDAGLRRCKQLLADLHRYNVAALKKAFTQKKAGVMTSRVLMRNRDSRRLRAMGSEIPSAHNIDCTMYQDCSPDFTLRPVETDKSCSRLGFISFMSAARLSTHPRTVFITVERLHREEANEFRKTGQF